VRKLFGIAHDATRQVSTHLKLRSVDMKKAICAMKAALGIRSIGGGSRWRWVHYHNI
jgi:hypothetical protein